MIVQNRAGETIEADIEERGPLADRLLFWLLKHPYQRVCDLSFVFQISTSTIWRQLQTLIRQALLECIRSTNVTSSRHPDTLYYLTSQGITHIADLVGGIDATRLAHMWKANETTYLRLLPRLQSYLSLQDAILRLIADAPRQLAYPGGYPATIRWHWQHDYVHPFERKKKRLTFRADGAVVFRRRPLRQAIQYQEGVAHQTGLPDACADIVTAAQSFHWMEPASTLAEIARLLRPGGIFAAYDYDFPPALNWELEQVYQEVDQRLDTLMNDSTLKGVPAYSPATYHCQELSFSSLQRPPSHWAPNQWTPKERVISKRRLNTEK